MKYSYVTNLFLCISKQLLRTLRQVRMKSVLAVMRGQLRELVEALRYKPEGRGFDSRWCHWNFSFT
jgi:hypothetical protein